MVLVLDGWRIDVPSRRAERGTRSVVLSPRAIRLVQVFAEAPGETFSRDTLLDRVWLDVTVSDESLSQVVSELRRKLDNRQLIATIPRGGYRMAAPLLREAGASGTTTRAEGSVPSIEAYALCLEARSCLGRAYEGALRDFTALASQAVALAPDDGETRALYAMALLKRHIYWSEGAGLIDSVLIEAEAAIRRAPDHAEGYLATGAAQIAVGRIAAGQREIAKALSLARGDAQLHLEAAIHVMAAGNHRSAAALAVRAADLDPAGSTGDLLAARYLERQDTARARIHAERALRKIRSELEIDPTALRALYGLGPLLAQLGDAQGAGAVLDSLPHQNSPLEYYRALGFARLGDVSSALERIDFLLSRGWRGFFSIDADEGFRPVRQSARFRRLQRELMSA
ncbi:winged helix-turn-helix domain-containing protein [Roseobacter sp. YSTF-M11]|uniref:Winged helix-turn-helix domain-containing protein n=1 Tax=Roseobacter insulae TaxID=2859783 RepID=A0A9X1K238_9RHOB|nr:winged helix-turn-helix domain-containing protein [Roseobacter insulae]MBW4709844.1 winged helix-turn-helix domain-containing protein [Roseobacter insulae]